MNASYKDVRFSNNSCNQLGTELSYEIDSYDASTGKFWVLVNLSTGNNMMSMYYGNNSVETTSNGTAVFGPSYSAVYHLNALNGSESIGNSANYQE